MSSRTYIRLGQLAIAASTVAAVLTPREAAAVPSFARQTGFSCSQCHTSFPELTPFGRAFKVSGFTMTTTKTVKDIENEKSVLDIPGYTPLSVMIQGEYVHTNAPQNLAGTTHPLNDDFVVPQQASVFYAGRIAPKVGGMIQITYSGVEDKVSIDNTDIRFADTASLAGTDLTYGFSINNNPTVTDLWHGTPAWGMPYAAADVSPTPAAAALIDGALAQQVAGLNAYAYWNSTVYAELAAYHSNPVGAPRPLDAATGATNVVKDFAPYWRVAAQRDFGVHSIEVGTYGMQASVFPGGTSTTSSSGYNALMGPTNQFLDTAVDVQYQYIGEKHIATFIANWTHEIQHRDADAAIGTAGFSAHTLDEGKITAAYIYDRWLRLHLSFNEVNGTSDPTLYAPGPVSGSASGSPKSQSVQGELDYMPWLNIRLGLQYTNYFAFNGGTTNYDGSGRNASSNNTVYAFGWFAF